MKYITPYKTMFKQFAIFKNTKTNDKQPDYKLSAKIDDKYVEIGAGWIKDGTKGKFIAVKLSDEYQGKPGFVLEMEKSTQPNFDKDSKGTAIAPQDIPF